MVSQMNEIIDVIAATLELCHCCGKPEHGDAEFQCLECCKCFKLKSSWKRHQQDFHDEDPVWMPVSPNKETPARYKDKHKGVKPFACAGCSKRFSRKYDLERHVVHTGCTDNPRPTYVCKVCKHVFSRKDNLQEHIRANCSQIMKKKAKYKCHHCNKTFHSINLLKIHMKTHPGQKRYKCHSCCKCFGSDGALKKHCCMLSGKQANECKKRSTKKQAGSSHNQMRQPLNLPSSHSAVQDGNEGSRNMS